MKRNLDCTRIIRSHPQGMGGRKANCVGTSLNWASGTFELSRTRMTCFGRNLPNGRVFEREWTRTGTRVLWADSASKLIPTYDGRAGNRTNREFREVPTQ